VFYYYLIKSISGGPEATQANTRRKGCEGPSPAGRSAEGCVSSIQSCDGSEPLVAYTSAAGDGGQLDNYF